MEGKRREKDEMRLAIAGAYDKDKRKRSRKMGELVEFVRDNNDPSEDSSDSSRVEYELRDDDEEGEDLVDPREKKKKRATSTQKALFSPSNVSVEVCGTPVAIDVRSSKLVRSKVRGEDRLVFDSKGKTLVAKDGLIIVNLGKFILRKISQDSLLALNKAGVLDSDSNPLDETHRVCLLHNPQNPKHDRFVKVGKNTGNIRKHCERNHATTLAALERLVGETPQKETEDAITQFLLKQSSATGKTLNRFWGRDITTTALSQEVSVLIWFLDAQIPFSQLDNHLFRKMLQTFGPVDLASSSTIVETILPFLYRYCTAEMVSYLLKCQSYIVSYDGWSKFGSKFISQHYHCITPTFEYRPVLLDLIPVHGQQFTEVVAAVLDERQSMWFGGVEESQRPISAGAIADGASNVQSSGKYLFGENDMHRCHNHILKKVVEVGESTSTYFKQDFKATVSFCQHVSGNWALLNYIHYFRRMNDLSELVIVLQNDTRWEGRFKVLCRMLELKDELKQAFGQTEQPLPFVVQQREHVDDFLEDPFFDRLSAYKTLFGHINDVSRLYQTKRFPTGCLVPLCCYYLKRCFIVNAEQDTPYCADLKRSLGNAVEIHLCEPVLKRANNFLKAALFHPGVARTLPNFVEKQVLEDCWESIVNDGSALQCRKRSFALGLGAYQEDVIAVRIELESLHMDMPSFMSDLKKSGAVNGITALGYWGDIVTQGDDLSKEISFIAPVAAMLLALPAGEAIDESTFSGTGHLVSNQRASMAPATVEMVTIIRMFIRTFQWSPQDVEQWYKTQKSENQTTVKLKATKKRKKQTTISFGRKI